jgi:intracellular sulfur oxidation DsrE/DsrF family protein
MKKIILLTLLIATSSSLFAQLPEHLEGKMSYPVFDFHPWVGVVKNNSKVLDFNKKLDYKIVIDVYARHKDSTTIMTTLGEVARTYNLNVANGVPQKNLKMAVVIHGGAINGILSEAAYQKKYKTSNPNIEVIKLMKKEGIKFYICGQNLAFRQTAPEDILKDMEIALSAKTALITLDQMGYTYMSVNN